MDAKPDLDAPWTFKLGDDRSPYNGVIRSASRELLNLRATMNADDEAKMRCMAAAPELLDALKDLARITEALQGYIPPHLAKVVEETQVALVKARDAITKAKAP